jgi:hypothetical protein
MVVKSNSNTCNCCGKEYSYSDLPQELNSIYRTKDINHICDNCKGWADKKVQFARQSALDFQVSFVTRALKTRRNNYLSSTQTGNTNHSPTKLVVRNIIKAVTAFIVLVILLTGSTYIIVQEKDVNSVLWITTTALFIFLYSYFFIKKLNNLVEAIIIEEENKARIAIDSIMDIADNKKYEISGHAYDSQVYETLKAKMTTEKPNPHNSKSRI